MAEPQHLERGVRNPAIIDLIRPAAGRYGVVLVMIEDRPWSGERAQLEELDAKLNAYFAYVLDGHLTAQYPEYLGVPVQVELDCIAEPGAAERAMLREATRVAGEHGIRFALRVVAPEDIRRAPWEEGGADAEAARRRSPPYRYTADVRQPLAALGILPTAATPPAKVRALVNALYVFEIRERKLRRDELEEFFGPQPLDRYAEEIAALRRKYAPLSLPLERWTEGG